MGFGTSPHGTSPHGLGSPSEGFATTGAPPFRSQASGVGQTGRFIDPSLRDYVMLSDGTLAGMPSVQQLVELAILGRAFRGRLSSLDRMGSNFVAAVRTVVDIALRDLVVRGLIRVVTVEAARVTPNRARVLVRWQDLVTGRVVTTEAS